MNCLHSMVGNIIILLATFFTLFHNDLKNLTTFPSADPYFHTAMEVVFFILTIEFLAFIFFEKNYIGTFLFYLDFLAVLSLIPDTHFIINAITQHGDSLSGAEHLIKASHSSQAGARASRYLKLIRILTFMRIVRLAKVMETAKELKFSQVNIRRRLARPHFSILDNLFIHARNSEIAITLPQNNKKKRNQTLKNITLPKKRESQICDRRKSEIISPITNPRKSFKKNFTIISELENKKITNVSKDSILLEMRINTFKYDKNTAENINTVLEINDNQNMNEDSIINNIRKYHINLFTTDDPKEENVIHKVCKTEECDYQFKNPLKAELDNFLIRNAIDIDDLIEDKSIILLPEEPAIKKNKKGLIFNSFILNKWNEEHENEANPKVSLVELIKQEKGCSSNANLTPSCANYWMANKHLKEVSPQPGKNILNCKEVYSPLFKEYKPMTEQPKIKYIKMKRKKSNLSSSSLKSQNSSDKNISDNEEPFDITYNEHSQLQNANTSKKGFFGNILHNIDQEGKVNNSLYYESEHKRSINDQSIKSNSNSSNSSSLIDEEEINIKLRNKKMSGKKSFMNFTKMVPDINYNPEAITNENVQIKKNKANKITPPENHTKQKENLEEKLTSRMTNKLVFMILIILILFPVFEVDYLEDFIYDQENIPSIQMYCMNSIDDAFLKAVEDLSFIKTINRLYYHCIDLAEDGSSIQATLQSLNLTNANYSLPNENTKLVPPYFYYINFTNYHTYSILQNKIANSSSNYSLPQIVYKHPGYDNLLETKRYEYNYIEQIFNPDIKTNSSIDYIYNQNEYQNLTSILSIFKIIFISFFLLYGAHSFSTLIVAYIVRPMDKVMTRLKVNLSTPDILNENLNIENIDKLDIDTAYKKALIVIEDNQISENKQKNTTKFVSRNAELNELDQKLKILINLISLGIGKQILDVVSCEERNAYMFLNLKQAGLKYNAVILMMKITNCDKLIKDYGEKAIMLINKVYTVFHTEALIHQGHVSSGKNFIIWKENKEKVEETFANYVRLLDEASKNREHDSKKDKNFEPNQNIVEFTKENITNLAFLCANKILNFLYLKLAGTFKIFQQYDVRINFFLNYGEIISGYAGHDLKIDEVFTGPHLNDSEKILSKLNTLYNQTSIFMHYNYANLLSPNLYNLIFPCDVAYFKNFDILKTVRIHKLYFNPYDNLMLNVDYKSDMSHNAILQRRKKLAKELNKFDNGVEIHILSDYEIRENTIKNIPYALFSQLKVFFDEYQNNRIRECIVTLRNISKSELYKNFVDEDFKKHFTFVQSNLKEKLNKSTKKEVNYTFKI